MAAKPKALRIDATRSVTIDRSARLYRLLQLLGRGPQKRQTLMQRLGLDVRGFYRDLELLREAGIHVILEKRRYILSGDLKTTLENLPFPDPALTLGEATMLARGRSRAHRKLRGVIKRITE